MGTITRSFANNIGTSGILKAGAFNNASLNNVTALNAAIATAGMVLLSTQTASNSASISFTTGIDSTYKEYQFWLVDIHPRTDNVGFQFQTSTNSGSSYGVTATTTCFETYHNENGVDSNLTYSGGNDLAQSTSYHTLNNGQGSDADQSISGLLTIFNPASTTYVKHFIARTSRSAHDNYASEHYSAGYFNTTSAINAIDFKMSSGNIDGTILLFGIK